MYIFMIFALLLPSHNDKQIVVDFKKCNCVSHSEKDIENIDKYFKTVCPNVTYRNMEDRDTILLIKKLNLTKTEPEPSVYFACNPHARPTSQQLKKMIKHSKKNDDASVVIKSIKKECDGVTFFNTGDIIALSGRVALCIPG